MGSVDAHVLTPMFRRIYDRSRSWRELGGSRLRLGSSAEPYAYDRAEHGGRYGMSFSPHSERARARVANH
jgi:hypothetical protein